MQALYGLLSSSLIRHVTVYILYRYTQNVPTCQKYIVVLASAAGFEHDEHQSVQG